MHTMKTEYSTKAYWSAQVKHTRRYGHTYLHTGARAIHPFPGIPLEIDGIAYRWGSYGRSLQSGGHKYKVYATRNGKPVPSKEL